MLSQESIILLSLLLRAIVILVFCPQPPSSLDAVLVSICTSLHWGSQCDGAWCVPLSGLSWLPSKIACGPLPLLQAPSPHPPIVDGFNVLLAWENSQHFTMPPLVSPQNDVWCQCRNSMLTMCRHYPDLGTSDTSPVENLLHPIRVVISHQWGISALIPQTSFCGESAGDITKCWLFSQAVVPNGGGMNLLKFVLRNNGCGHAWQNSHISFWKPGEKIRQNATWLKELIIISGWSQFRLSQSHSMSHSFVFSLIWVNHNAHLR